MSRKNRERRERNRREKHMHIDEPAHLGPTSTPSATWRAKGEEDPHAGKYDCERAQLTLGKLTDDELAYGIFMNYDVEPPIEDIIAQKPGVHRRIIWASAAKERIRWLSRSLEKAQADLVLAVRDQMKFEIDPDDPMPDKTIETYVKLFLEAKKKAADAAADKVICARMGHGFVAMGSCFSEELQEPGIIFLALDEPGEIGEDTTHVFQVGQQAPVDKVQAYVSFAGPKSVDQVITELEKLKTQHWPEHNREWQFAPPGYALVPTKHEGRAGLTDAMMRAFYEAYNANEQRGDFERLNAGYNALVEAARPNNPTPEVEESDAMDQPQSILTDAQKAHVLEVWEKYNHNTFNLKEVALAFFEEAFFELSVKSADESIVPPLSAFQLLKTALQNDSSYAWSWLCNFSMPIMDSIKCSPIHANVAGAYLMKHIFDIDVKTFSEWKSLEIDEKIVKLPIPAEMLDLAKMPGYPWLPCPICHCVEGCDDSVPERYRAHVAKTSNEAVKLPQPIDQELLNAITTDLVAETERAIAQRDKFKETGISTASHGGSHDTCFETILRKHLVAHQPVVDAKGVLDLVNSLSLKKIYDERDRGYNKAIGHVSEKLDELFASQPAKLDVSFSGGTAPTHYCKVCGAMWYKGADFWSLRSKQCGKCCDSVAMGDQIVAMGAQTKEIPPIITAQEQVTIIRLTRLASIAQHIQEKSAFVDGAWQVTPVVFKVLVELLDELNQLPKAGLVDDVQGTLFARVSAVLQRFVRAQVAPEYEDGWEYETKEYPRKGWAQEFFSPEGEGWERDYSKGRPGEAWDRFDNHEEMYWKRRKPKA
jgi:hypothetical protein